MDFFSGAGIDLVKFAAGEVGTFKGYGAVFGNRDSQGDIIVPGAFKGAVGKTIPMMFNHFEGVIGKITPLEEDSKGLVVEGEFTPGVQAADEVRALAKHGAVTGLSIRGRVAPKDAAYDEATNTRTIRRVDPLMEISVVTFPANSKARIAAGTIKSMEEFKDCERLADVEEILRDAGFSPEAARAFVSKAKPAFVRDALRVFEERAKVEKAVAEFNETLRKMREGK
jgi:uncharacterized protein